MRPANERWRYNATLSLIGWVHTQNGPSWLDVMHPANERRRYNVTSSLIGWAHTQNDTSWLAVMCPANERWRYNVTSSLIGWAHTQNDSSWLAVRMLWRRMGISKETLSNLEMVLWWRARLSELLLWQILYDMSHAIHRVELTHCSLGDFNKILDK